MPNEVILYVLPLLLIEHSLLDPPHTLPPLELELDLSSTDGLSQVEEDLPLDGVACEVEGLIDLDEYARHQRYYINMGW